MGNLLKFAQHELKLAGVDKPDSDYNGMLADAVLELIKVFSKQGHSGFSAGLVVQMFSKVAMFEPLTPLTGDDTEWNKITDNLYQNNRCSYVFKEGDNAYNSQGKIFKEPNGVCYTGPNSRTPISFPYIPHSEYIDVT